MVPGLSAQVAAGSGGWGLWLLAAFFVFLGLLALLAPVARAEVDGRAREVRVFKRWPWGEGRVRVVDFAEIGSVDVDTDVLDDGSSNYRPILRLHSGGRCCLSPPGRLTSGMRATPRTCWQLSSAVPRMRAQAR